MTGRIKRRAIDLIVIVLLLFLVSGCLYPEKRLSDGMEALPRHVSDVQQAIDRYQEKHAVLPIKTVEADTPLYRKYVIDFSRLLQYIGETPSSAFENGGNFLYVLIDVEENPTVKLFDLRVTDELRTVQQEVNRYTIKEDRYPRGKEIAPGVFELNEELLRHASMKIPSPYHPQTKLPLVMASDGTVYVDYKTDIERLIEDRGSKPPPDIDLRTLLTEDALFVPAQSMPYHYQDGEVIFDPDP